MTSSAGKKDAGKSPAPAPGGKRSFFIPQDPTEFIRGADTAAPRRLVELVESGRASNAQKEAVEGLADSLTPTHSQQPAPKPPSRGDDSGEKKSFLVRLPVSTHARLNWLVDHTPRSSIQKIILDGIEAEVERRIAAIQANDGRAIG